jgi:hypothetical protein
MFEILTVSRSYNVVAVRVSEVMSDNFFFT